MTTKLYDPNDPMPSVLTAVGAIVLAGTLGYIALVPAPTKKGIVARARTKEREIQLKIEDAKQRQREIEAILAQRKSALPPDAIGPDALARITRLATAGGLTLTGFRPQRTIESPTGVTIYPYTITATGTFPATAKFIRSIETTTKDIAVTSYAATSSDAESSVTGATIGIVLFGDTPKRPSSRPTPGTGAAGAAGTTPGAAAARPGATNG